MWDIPGLGISPGVENGNPLQYSCLERSMNRRAWQATVHGVANIPWSRKWQPTPVFLPVKFHGQRILAGYGPWAHKESDTEER